ncbi:hypothetical protein [Streptomyces sp. SLBN-118]|nr:hypothetical protein [Streptomyces sp. SLBN-118]
MRCAQVVRRPGDRLGGHWQATLVGAQPRPRRDGQHRIVDDRSARQLVP